MNDINYLENKNICTKIPRWFTVKNYPANL